MNRRELMKASVASVAAMALPAVSATASTTTVSYFLEYEHVERGTYRTFTIEVDAEFTPDGIIARRGGRPTKYLIDDQEVTYEVWCSEFS